MAHRWLGVAVWTAAALLMVAYTAAPAAAQNTINQTTCGGVSGVGSCLTNGFLQDLTVTCNGQGPEFSAALARIIQFSGGRSFAVRRRVKARRWVSPGCGPVLEG